MPSKIVKQKNFERNTRIIREFCKENNIDLVELNDGYQLRVEDMLDLYPVRGRWHNIKTGERGDWNGYADLRKLMLDVLQMLSPLAQVESAEQELTIKYGVPPELQYLAKPSDDVANATRNVSRAMTMRIEQQVRIVMKPKPKFLTEKMWVRLAAIFIYIEKTQPSMQIEQHKTIDNT